MRTKAQRHAALGTLKAFSQAVGLPCHTSAVSYLTAMTYKIKFSRERGLKSGHRVIFSGLLGSTFSAVTRAAGWLLSA